MGQEDRTWESVGSQQGGASFPHCEAAVPCGQDKVSKPQEEPAPLLSALCIGESRHVSADGKAERILLDNGISAPLFPNFWLKREIQEGAIGIALHTLLHCNLCLRTRWL